MGQGGLTSSFTISFQFTNGADESQEDESSEEEEAAKVAIVQTEQRNKMVNLFTAAFNRTITYDKKDEKVKEIKI